MQRDRVCLRVERKRVSVCREIERHYVWRDKESMCVQRERKRD